MTHDKLLAKLVQTNAGPLYQALRAVVELHKRIYWKDLRTDTSGYECERCPSQPYPCPTIQAIEKELG